MIEFLKNLGIGIATAFQGVPMTLFVTIIAVICGLLIGFLIAFMRMSRFKPLNVIAMVYTDILRGTPLLVQVLIFAYGIPAMIQSMGIQFKWPTLLIPALICCTLNSSAYMGEIVRSGLQAIDIGQREAAASLGMTHSQAQRLIVIPQAVRIILPPLGNEFVTMIKETAILSYVAIEEITLKGALLAAKTFEFFTAYGGVAIVYLIFTIPLSKFVLYLEKRLDVGSK